MPISTAGLADVFPPFPDWATDYYEDSEGAIWVYSEDSEDRTEIPYMVWHPSHGTMADSTHMRLGNMDLRHGRQGLFWRFSTTAAFEREVRRVSDRMYGQTVKLVEGDDAGRRVFIDPDQGALGLGS